MRKIWITNTKTKRFVEVVGNPREMFDGDWKENYAPTKGADWLDVQAFSIHGDGYTTRNGVPYEYDLCCDGGMFTLLVDTGTHNEEDIKKAKYWLRHDRDVVSLRVLRLKRQAGAEVRI